MNVAVEEIMARLELVAVEAGRRSAEIEAARALPTDLVDALIDTGVFRLTVPVSLGGVDAGPAAVVRAARSLAYHDGSTGWVVMSALVAGAGATGLPRHHAVTVLGEPRTIVVGHGEPGGVGRLTDDGGLVVTGRWSWGSGVAASSWVRAGVRIEEEAAEAEADEGDQPDGPTGPRTVHCLLRRDQVVALDTWHALGLRGAGSTDFQVTEAFVPEGRWVTSDVEPSSDFDRASMSSDDLLAVGIAAVALGLAARAIDESATSAKPIVERGRGSRGAGPGGGSAASDEAGPGRAERARFGVALAAADALLDRTISAFGADPAPARSPVSPANPLGASIHAVDAAVRAVEQCYRAGGPAAVLHASPLQRLLRDIQVVAQHPAVAPTRWDGLGATTPTSG